MILLTRSELRVRFGTNSAVTPNGLNLLSTCLGGAADDPILVYALQSINQNPYRPA